MLGIANSLLGTAIRANAARTSLLILTNCLSTGSQLALPAVLGRTVDALVSGHGFPRWLLMCVGLVVLYVTAEAASDFLAGAMQARSALFLRRLATQRFLAAGPYSRPTTTAGEFTAQILESAAAAAMGPSAVVWLGFSVAPAVVSLVALWWLDVWVGLAFTCGLPVVAWCLKSFAVDSSRLVSRYLADQAEIAGRLAEALGGSGTIAASHTLDRELRRVLEPLPTLRRSGDELWKLQGRTTAQSTVLFPLLQIAVVAVAGLELARGAVTPGQLLAAAEYAAIGTGLGMVVMFVNQLARARAGAERLSAVTTLAPMEFGSTVASDQGHRGPGACVEFSGVVVEHRGRVILDGIHLTVAAGRVTALVGRSGSGKSMATALMGRLLDPTRGQVLLDGVPLPYLTREALRCQIAFAFEKPRLMGRDVTDAIAAGARRTTRENVVRAARLARADAFIEKLPSGFATDLKAAAMSGGELQRVGLARAFVRQSRVLLLDDAMSSLDMATEHEIDQALEAGEAGTTRVIIAHRVSSAARADTVVWLEEGRVRAIGTHRSLWQQEDYRAIFQTLQCPTASGTAAQRAAE
ncbi:ABC transporter ATP-binding protein [Streptomyces sp. CA2R101]|uniref:ABC transporter ATP-binding protein n=1 Tax=Streptomyces sp. CA2R101 TaxID=3120152 RepID=UPI003009B20A